MNNNSRVRRRVAALGCFALVLACHEGFLPGTISPSWTSPPPQISVTPPPPPAFSRTAFLITVNATSPRTQRSRALLEGVGFAVRLALAPDYADKVVSNKHAQLLIYARILAGPDAWGYVFEDDIMLNGASWERFEDKVNFTAAGTLPALEAERCPALYLGVCGPRRPATARPDAANRYCGRCAHAYGVSRGGARRLLKYVDELEAAAAGGDDARYMDLLLERVCVAAGGFPVSHVEKRSSQASGHKGAFVQDRRTFKSLIGPT